MYVFFLIGGGGGREEGKAIINFSLFLLAKLYSYEQNYIYILHRSVNDHASRVQRTSHNTIPTRLLLVELLKNLNNL